jgi:hypothetical protein
MLQRCFDRVDAVEELELVTVGKLDRLSVFLAQESRYAQ